jgi:hypothetical protein
MAYVVATLQDFVTSRACPCCVANWLSQAAKMKEPKVDDSSSSSDSSMDEQEVAAIKAVAGKKVCRLCFLITLDSLRNQRVVGFAYLKAFMKKKPPSQTPQNVDLNIINILLSIFAILISIIIEIVKDQRAVLPAGLENLLGAVSLFSIVVAVSITHSLVGPKRHSKWQLWQPFLGGWRFVTIQSVAWSLLALSLYLSGLALHPSFEKIYPSQMFGATFPTVWTLTCVMGLLAEVLLISSLPLFESPTSESPSTIQLRWNDVGTINIIVSVIAMLTFFFLEKLRPLHNFTAPQVHQVLGGAAGGCIIVAIALTHMIVGKMCHGANWKWWQAFEGGWRCDLTDPILIFPAPSPSSYHLESSSY